MRRFFFVFFSYATRAASKISFKLEERELEAEGPVLDMVTATREGLGSEYMGSTARIRVRSSGSVHPPEGKDPGACRTHCPCHDYEVMFGCRGRLRRLPERSKAVAAGPPELSRTISGPGLIYLTAPRCSSSPPNTTARARMIARNSKLQPFPRVSKVSSTKCPHSRPTPVVSPNTSNIAPIK